MKIGIIGAMAQEVSALKNYMEHTESWEAAGNFFYQGKIGNHEVIVVQSGIGKVLAAMTATLLIEHYKVDILLNTGSAGGIGDGLAVGDLVISEKLAYFDVDVTAFGYAPGQMAGMPLYYEASKQVMEKVINAANKKEVRVRTGLITTGDSFVAGETQINQIKQNFPDVLATEMEGAAIAQVAVQFKIPFAVIRAISDTGNDEASISFDAFIQLAGKQSAELVIDLIESW